MSEVYRLVKARKEHRCDDYPCTSKRVIAAGEDYVRAVAFPDGDVNTSDRPWVLRLCVSCATKYGRKLPPRKTVRTSPDSQTGVPTHD